jgi:threonine/homoserine/homoserine lactone efflux protein
MPELPPMLVAALTGFISGLLLSIPVGPVNLTIINEGARRGFAWAAMIGLGAVVMEVIYCTLAFTGFASFFEKGVIKAAMELFSFVFMLFISVKFLLAKTVTAATHLTAATDKLEERLEERLHPHSAFATGFVRVMGNPGVFLFWIILAANFISREWVAPNWPGKLACVGGVAVGVGLWFMGLSYAVSFGHKKFSERTLILMERISGLVLLTFALLHGGHIVWQMARHRM